MHKTGLVHTPPDSVSNTEASNFAQFKSTFLFHLDLVSELGELALSGMQHSLVYLIHVSAAGTCWVISQSVRTYGVDESATVTPS